MGMEITLTLKEVAIIAIVIAIVVFFAYCTSLVKNLIITVKRTNVILEDAQVISKIAAERTQQVDGTIDNVISRVANFASTKMSKSEDEKTKEETL